MLQFKIIFLCLSSLVSGNLFAKIIPWTDHTPSALAPFQNNAKTVAALTGNDIFLYSHPEQKLQFSTPRGSQSYNRAQFSSAAIVVNATPQQIHTVLKDYSNYVGIFPTLTKAKILHQENNTTQIKYRVSIPTPIKVLNLNEDITIQYHLSPHSLSSVIIDSPIQFGFSKIEWFPIDTQRSLITLTQWNDLDSTKGFLINTLIKAMPELKDGMPYGNNAFIIESLNLKFNGISKVNTLAAGKIPDKHLSQSQYQQILQLSKVTRQPISFIHPNVAIPYTHGNETLRFTTSYQYFNSPLSKTQELLKPTSYQTLFPKHIRKIDLIKMNDKSQDAVFHVRAGLGVITIPFTLRLRFDELTEHSVDMYAVGGDLKFVKNRISLSSVGQHSVLKMSSAAKIDNSAPFLLRAMRSLPYHDVLPSASMARVINQKAQTNLDFK